jgi:hypothetical protein
MLIRAYSDKYFEVSGIGKGHITLLTLLTVLQCIGLSFLVSLEQLFPFQHTANFMAVKSRTLYIPRFDVSVCLLNVLELNNH